ncbi:MAG: hypothetical protein ACIAQ0_00250 [Phycisphaerales bacterium JB058]|jgi:hypothetical protein
MSQPNLLPQSIKVKVAQRRRLIVWLKSVAVVAVFGVVGCVVAGAYLGDLKSPVRDELDSVRSVINKLEASEAAAWTRIETVTHELGVAEDIAGQPNWNVLLGVLAAGLNDGAYLEQIETSLVMDEGVDVAPPSRAASGPYRVRVTGISLMQGDATRYALYLENCRLFDSVRMVGTLPRPDVDPNAVGFEILCTIGTVEEKS